ncbi:HAMP domain-containing sensor histidine kinase [Amycolatopsis cynarae]|uniref:histidine kinase n=1 Tax=Amycolatopsis cynarae TaxID=2995223 RepID=A0ABY7AVC1_9PSEU|nr:HAMP domain-containing sensor histidine kinase [Amycolatopsis sp. HUAS 11-8]WAL63926.1 HAMP domain-containing sensor histidine kinase [Amycolatopsis sp. HUAS 11-8]
MPGPSDHDTGAAAAAAAPAAALVIDRRGCLVFANGTFGELSGTGVRQWRGAPEDAALKAIAARCRDEESAYRRLAAVRERGQGSEVLDLGANRVVSTREPLPGADSELGALWLFTEPPCPAAQQNHLLATVAHEFHTPLTALLSFAELLADARLGPLSVDQRSAAEAINRNAERLLRLVDDLLLLARLESRRLPLRFVEVDVPSLVRAAVVDRGPESAERGIELRCVTSAGPPIAGDPARLHQVLGNVLGNAVKYGAANSRVRVEAAYTEDRWTIEVADSGMGIPAEELDRITRGFERGSNAVLAGISGSGLGLAVSKELVESHGGTLELISVLDVGTTVRIVLPTDHRDGKGRS